MRFDTAAAMRAGIVFGLWAVLLIALILSANARDDGRYSDAPLKSWFDSLKSSKGLCCSFADGQAIEDVDVDSKDGRYRVRINGQWLDVPQEALVDVPNKFGRPVVWPYKDADGNQNTRARLGIDDVQREAIAIQGAKGKRLTYQTIDRPQA